MTGDLAICGAGLVYLTLVLTVNLDSPLCGVLLILLSARALVKPHLRKR